MTDDSSPTPRSRLEIDWVRTAAGALAAVSSAVVLSRVGAAGTIIGAALGSVVVTLASALYGQGLERSRQRIAQAHSQAMQRVGAAQAEVRRADRRRAHGGVADPAARSDLQHAEEHLVEAQRDLDRVSVGAPGPAPGLAWRDRLAALPWRRIALVAAGLFVLAVVLITAFELLAGRSVASYTGGTHGSGGTSISNLAGSDGGSGQTPTPEPSPSTSPSGGASPPAEPTPTAVTPSEPSGSASPSATPSAPAPTPSSSPTTTPSQAPVAAASDVPTP